MNPTILTSSCECQALEFRYYKFQETAGVGNAPDCGKEGECSDLSPLPIVLSVRITLTSTDSFLVGHKIVRA